MCRLGAALQECVRCLEVALNYEHVDEDSRALLKQHLEHAKEYLRKCNLVLQGHEKNFFGRDYSNSLFDCLLQEADTALKLCREAKKRHSSYLQTAVQKRKADVADAAARGVFV